MKKIISISILALLLCSSMLVAQSRELMKLQINIPCDKTEDLYNVLNNYGMQLLALGQGVMNIQVDANTTVLGDGLVEFFVNQETGSYGIVITNPNGISCMALAGSSFEPYAGKRPYLPLSEDNG